MENWEINQKAEEDKKSINKNEMNSKTLLSAVYLIIFISILIWLYYFYTQKNTNTNLISTWTIDNSVQLETWASLDSWDMDNIPEDFWTDTDSWNVISTTTSTVTTTITQEEVWWTWEKDAIKDNNPTSTWWIQGTWSTQGTWWSSVIEEELLNDFENIIDDMFNSLENYE